MSNCIQKNLPKTKEELDRMLMRISELMDMELPEGSPESYESDLLADILDFADDALIAYMEGAEKHQKMDLEGAVECYNLAIQYNPKYAPDYHSRAAANSVLKNSLDVIIDDQNRGIELDPNNPFSYFHRSHTRKELNDYSGAEEDMDNYNKLLDRIPIYKD